MPIRTRKSILFITLTITGVVFVLTAVAYFNGTGLLLAQTKPTNLGNQVKVVNNLERIEVEKTDIQGDKFILYVKNNFNKAINRFYLTTGTTSYDFELLYSDVQDSVPPLAEFRLQVDCDKELYEKGLVINSVLFDDNSGSGDPAIVRKMRDQRLGEKVQFISAQEMLDSFLNLEPESRVAKLPELKNTVQQRLMAKQPEDDSLKIGMNTGRQRVEMYLKEISSDARYKDSGFLGQRVFEFRNKLARYISKIN